VANKKSVSNIKLYKVANNIPTQQATLPEKYTEYSNLLKQPFGQRYGAIFYKKHTTLIMKDLDINSLLKKHIDSFYKELVKIYKKSNGYTDDFNNMHKNVQLALFDLIFNLGAKKLTTTFPNFTAALKKGDWKKAAPETNRPDVSPQRNKYVRQLLYTTPQKP